MDSNKIYDQVSATERDICNLHLSLGDSVNATGCFVLKNRGEQADLCIVKGNNFKLLSENVFDYKEAFAKCPSGVGALETFFIDDKTFCVVPVNHPEAAQFSQIRENASWPRFYAKATDEDVLARFKVKGQNSLGSAFSAEIEKFKDMRDYNVMKFLNKHNLEASYHYLMGIVRRDIKEKEVPIIKEDNSKSASLDEFFMDAKEMSVELETGNNVMNHYGLAQNVLKKVAGGVIGVSEEDDFYCVDRLCRVYCLDANGNFNALGKDVIAFIDKKTNGSWNAEKYMDYSTQEYEQIGREVAARNQQFVRAQGRGR